MDAQGNLTVVYMARNDLFDDGALGVSTITPGGVVNGDRAFTSSNTNLFDAWMATDRTGKLHLVWFGHDGRDTNSRIDYATPTGTPDGEWNIRLASSTDAGQTWSRITVNDDASCAVSERNSRRCRARTSDGASREDVASRGATPSELGPAVVAPAFLRLGRTVRGGHRRVALPREPIDPNGHSADEDGITRSGQTNPPRVGTSAREAHMRSMVCALALSAWALVGCKNPLVGKWESDGDLPGCNGGGDFRIDDNELVGDGSLTLSDGSVCFDCNFDLDATDDGDDDYTVDLDFNDCTIAGSTSMRLACTISGGDRLSCDAERPSAIKGTDISPYDRWDKVN